MKAFTSKLYRLPLSARTGMAILTAVIVVAVLTALATQFTSLSAFPGQSPATIAAVVTSPVGASETGTGTRTRRCPDCGMVESTRDVAGTQPEQSREITIRLPDGSIRVITDANPAKWRNGERVSIISGTD